MVNTVNKIQRGFSRAAGSYDLFTSLHRDIADKLLVGLERNLNPSALLDVGCGTGYLTMKALETYPKSRIIGVDFAQGMLDIARSKCQEISWILADSNHLPFADGHFDLVVSNLAFQWSVDLALTFSEVKRVLGPKGVLACTLFGFNTCQELFQSLDEAKSGKLQFTRLPREEQVRQALEQVGYKSPELHREMIKLEFTDMSQLIEWLKSIGANGLSREGFLGVEHLSRAASIYRHRFSYLNGVGATFEVLRVYAKK